MTAGDPCLVHGGSGGVGHVAVQVAAATSATVTATAAPTFHEPVAGLGGDTLLDYTRSDLEAAIIDAGRPDVILDPHINDPIDLDAALAPAGANIVAISGIAPDLTYSNCGMARRMMQTRQHFAMPTLPSSPPALERGAPLADRSLVQPVVDQTYPL